MSMRSVHGVALVGQVSRATTSGTQSSPIAWIVNAWTYTYQNSDKTNTDEFLLLKDASAVISCSRIGKEKKGNKPKPSRPKHGGMREMFKLSERNEVLENPKMWVIWTYMMAQTPRRSLGQR
jgi:hypothetical protein